MKKGGSKEDSFSRKNLACLRSPRTSPSCPSAVCAIGDAMAAVIGKVWAYFVNFGTQNPTDPAEKTIISAVNSHKEGLRAAHDNATPFDAGAAREKAINHVMGEKHGTKPTHKDKRVMCRYCLNFFSANRCAISSSALPARRPAHPPTQALSHPFDRFV